MPKEQIRKRGRRKPKTEEEGYVKPQPSQVVADAAVEPEAPQAGPSGLHPDRVALLSGRRPTRAEPTPSGPEQAGEIEEAEQQPWGRTFGLDQEWPFGQLDPDLKGYFRTVEDQIKDWEGTSSSGEQREDRQNFLASVLAEVRGNELKISTDPDTAVVLERLLPSLGDWGRRVIGDAFGGQWELLLRHRFGSHVVQTWLTLAADTLDREERGQFPPQQAEQLAEQGVLPTMAELVKGLVETIQPNLAMMLTNPFASPPVRLLWLVISPDRPLPALDASAEEGMIRSKKSKKYRKGQGVQGKSILGDDAKGKGREGRRVPKQLVKMRKTLRKGLMEKLGGAEWRMMGVNAVGCPAVQLLLEFEVEDGHAERPNSLLDHLTEGIITVQKEGGEYEQQPYLVSLLTLSTGTRLFETLLLHSPQPVFSQIWSTYFEKQIGKLAIHPMSNFVVAKGVERLGVEGIERVAAECKAVSGGRGMIKSARTSVLLALVERATKLRAGQDAVMSLVRSAIHLPEGEDRAIVPCLMSLNTYPTYNAIVTGTEAPSEDLPSEVVDQKAEDEAAAVARRHAWENRRKPKADGEFVPNMQGCLLLQAIAQMPDEAVLQSLVDQALPTLITYAKSSIASHLLDVTLVSPAVPVRLRRRLINLLIPSLRELLDDKIGSRVAEKIWEAADGYTKEKMARALLPHAMAIGASQYGRYLHPKLQFHLLERRPDEWRANVIGVKHHFAHQKPQPAPVVTEVVEEEEGERKRKRDEIDELFKEVEGRGKKGKRVKA